MTDSLTDAQVMARLSEAARGLLLMSESDYPLTPFVWERGGGADNSHGLPPSPAEFLTQAGLPLDTPVEERTVEQFFAAARRVYEGMSEREQEAARRFNDLVQVVTDLLEHATVFRVGRIEIQAFVVGVAPSGNLAGYATTQIET